MFTTLKTAIAALVLVDLSGQGRAAVPPGAKGEPYTASRTFVFFRAPGIKAAQAWFICDATNADRVFIVTIPDAQGRIAFPEFSKRTDLKVLPRYYRLGTPDPGAGQVHWPVLELAGGQVGDLHAFNPGALDNPLDAFTPTFTSLKYWDLNVSCRWVKRTRLMGYSEHRTFVVSQMADGGLEYQSFDFKDAATAKVIEPDGAQRTTSPSLDIRGGNEVKDGFQFEHGGFTYDLKGTPADAAITVLKGGRRILREPLIAWTIAPRR